jgi:hypothetical protein
MRLAFILALGGAAALALLTRVPASAQALGTGIPLNQDATKSPAETAKLKAIDDAYKATLKKMPDAKQTDPWGNMRSADTASGGQAKAVQIKPKTAPKKTNNAAN